MPNVLFQDLHLAFFRFLHFYSSVEDGAAQGPFSGTTISGMQAFCILHGLTNTSIAPSRPHTIPFETIPLWLTNTIATLVVVGICRFLPLSF
jgi:hypothetical protein